MNEQKVKLPLPEIEFQQQVLEQLQKLNDRVGYLIAQQQAILIRLESVEHSLSMLEIEKMDDR
jgi:chaperonin cofactor prefoldin